MGDDGQLKTEKRAEFERVVPGPIERVWQFLTGSAELAQWLDGGTIEPRAGGSVSIADGHIRGVVTTWRPPTRLIYTWNVYGLGENESQFPESYLSFDLEPKGTDVRLTLRHRPVLEAFEGLTLMGWHTFLNRLGTLLRGETPEARETLMERPDPLRR